jgi:hypothetical protein
MDKIEFDDDLFEDNSVAGDSVAGDYLTDDYGTGDYGTGDINQQVKTGGTIKVNSSMFKWMAVVLLIVAIIWILYGIYNQIKIHGEDRNQRLTRVYFNNIRGEDFDEEAANVLQYGEAIDNPRAIDHYRVGAVYLLNAQNPREAHRHFTQALTQIINGTVDAREAPFILDRIEDFRDHFVDFNDIEDLPIQRALYAHFENQNRLIQHVNKEKKNISTDDPNFKQKTILARQEWQSDSQNVHDAAIYEELKNQINTIRDENRKIKDIQLHDYNEAINWLRVRYRDYPEKLHDIDKVVQTIGQNYPVGIVPGIHEKDIITAIWQRTYDPENSKNATSMREALGDAMLDCVERGHLVCMSGRTSKVWQALARLDKNEEMGVLKTKQAIRNEIYQKAAKIVDDFIGENGSASQVLKEAYNKNDNTEQVQELIETMKNRIDELRDEYQNHMNKDQLQSIIEECKAVV